MDIQDYFSRLNNETQKIFKQSIKEKQQLGKSHHFSSCISELSEHISDPVEKQLFITVSAQLEASTLNAVLGMYRQAFSSLRLALEMGLAVIYFSINKLELQEWLEGRNDIRWGTLLDEEKGVLSARFSKAFFNELSSETATYKKKASETYRTLSEFVHGNSETWERSGLKISHNEHLLEEFFKNFSCVSETLIFCATCRYAKSFNQNTIESLQFIPEELNHIPAIRSLFGGPRE